MKRKSFKSLLATAVVVCTLVGNVCPAMAAETQEVSGSGAQSKDVKVTAEIQSVYSVSLPAVLELTEGKMTFNGWTDAPGYYCQMKYGVAGKISSDEKVYVRPQYPIEMHIIKNGQIQATIKADEISGNYGNYPNGHNGTCKKEWSSSEIGSCDYDGTTISNCDYAFCCSEGHWIGIKAEDVSEYGSYEGNLTFNFGIE